jgi:hypothetical protein
MTPSREPRRERWQTLLIAPADLLELLRLAGDPSAAQVPQLPPDAVVRDGGFDAERGCFVVVLESAFFEEATVAEQEGSMVGNWEEVMLRLGDRAPEPIPSRPEIRVPVPWEAWNIAPSLVPELLGRLAEGGCRLESIPPPDAQVVEAYYDPERRCFAIVLESALFSPAHPRKVGSVLHLALPERTVGFAE